jgi:MFS family permease
MTRRGSSLHAADPAMVGLMALAALNYTSSIGCRITVALAGLHAGLSPALIGPMVAGFALIPMFFGVRAGRLVDRIGPQRPMVVGTALIALGAAACALSPHPAVLMASAIFIGLGNMGFHLSMQQAAGELGGGARRTGNFNLLTMSFSISGILGPPLAGFIIDHFGHRAAFAAMAVIAFGIMIGCRLFPFEKHLPRAASAGPHAAPDAAPDAPQTVSQAANARAGTRTAGASAPSIPPQSAWASGMELLGEKPLRRFLIASLTISAGWDAFQFLIPLHAHAIGLSASAVGLSIASFSAGSLTVRLFMSFLLARLSTAQWVMVAMGTCAAAYALLPFSGALPVLMAIAFVLGTGPGIGQPLLMAAMHGAAPAGRGGETAGLRMTLQSTQQIVLPVLLGLLGTVLGVSPLFWLYSGLVAAVMLSMRGKLGG